MSDCEKLVKTLDEVHERKKSARRVLTDKDDFSGMAVNMVKRIDPREIFILWITFVAIHCEIFSVQVLSRFNGTTNEDKTMTVKGTMYASIFMMMVVIICKMIF